MPNKILLVCDLDNTLYDWVSYFVPSFYAMVDVAVDILACDREQLLDDLREVHQRHNDSEHPFALLETTTVQQHFRGCSLSSIAKTLDPAFYAFNVSRKRNLRLFDGVIETLDQLACSGVTLVTHTESRLHGALGRLQRLGLLDYFAKIYCRERSETNHPDLAAADKWIKMFSLNNVNELSHHQSKPNPDVLLEICAKEQVSASDAAYIGDSVAKDMLMAKRSGVYAIWAAYGAQPDKRFYEALVRVSHWTPDEVARERRLRLEASNLKPDYIASQSFAEVVEAIKMPSA